MAKGLKRKSLRPPSEKTLKADSSYSFCIDWLLGSKYVRARFFNMLLVVKTGNADLPPIGFCIVFLLGSKYDGSAVKAVAIQ